MKRSIDQRTLQDLRRTRDMDDDLVVMPGHPKAKEPGSTTGDYGGLYIGRHALASGQLAVVFVVLRLDGKVGTALSVAPKHQAG